MRELQCDVLIVGGGTGAVAAAKASCAMGMRVIMTEETAWLGGQLTSQAVPPDEHPWIEQFGCTARYRRYRNHVRQYYRVHSNLRKSVRQNPTFNPGGGWVSRLCHEPAIGHYVIHRVLQPYIGEGLLHIMLHTVAAGACVLTDKSVPSSKLRPEVESDRIQRIHLLNLKTAEEWVVSAKYFIDATEMGELLPLTGTEYVVGAESKTETGEPNAVEGDPQPDNVQGITWVFAMAATSGENQPIERPEQYDKWRAFHPPFWPGPLIGRLDINPHTMETREIPFMSDDWRNFFRYRQIVDPTIHKPDETIEPVTIVNWPMNDYFEASTLEVDQATLSARLYDAKQLSLSLLYWLQTEAGHPNFALRPDITATEDGFAMTPYIRESRRIRALTTVKEQDVATDCHPGEIKAPSFFDSVGVGAYRIDLHPSTNGCSYIDTSSLPFEIPLGALVPIRMRNLIPACKNLGVTHLTNGCYRLHPVEWNIGEAAGSLAAFCVQNDLEPQQVVENAAYVARFQGELVRQGVELHWPELRPL